MDFPAKRRRDGGSDLLGAAIYTAEPEPPYQGLAQDLIYLSFEIDPEVVRPFVPAALRLAPSNTGFLALYTCSSSWGIGPHERALLAVEIEGQDSPDTSNAMFLVGSIIDNHAVQILEPRYGGGSVSGRVQTSRQGEVVRGSATVNGVPWIEVTIRLKGELIPDNSGIDRYIGLTPRGIVQHDIAYTATAMEGDLLNFSISSEALPGFIAMGPGRCLVAAFNPVLAGAWSVPQTLTVEGDNASLSAYLDLMEREGRPAVIFRGDGTPLRANRAAEALLGKTTSVTLRDAVRAAAADRAVVAKPVLLPCEEGRPLLAHLVQIRPPGTIEDAVLALLVDTDVAQHRESVPLLRVLGLTNAEALLAELIGSGMSVRDAATASGISEHTARSTLKLVYAKLGITKSSQLGNLVARLRFV